MPISTKADTICIFTMTGSATMAVISGLKAKIEMRYGVSTEANHDDPHRRNIAVYKPVISCTERIRKTKISILLVTSLTLLTRSRLDIRTVSPIRARIPNDKAAVSSR
jgi:hypothetical protein